MYLEKAAVFPPLLYAHGSCFWKENMKISINMKNYNPVSSSEFKPVSDLCSHPVKHAVQQTRNHREYGGLQGREVVHQSADVTLEVSDASAVHQNHTLGNRGLLQIRNNAFTENKA